MLHAYNGLYLFDSKHGILALVYLKIVFPLAVSPVSIR